ncbi:MAG: hypothetical protein ACAI34_22455 [Verrucomicrobium sp.]
MRSPNALSGEAQKVVRLSEPFSMRHPPWCLSTNTRITLLDAGIRAFSAMVMTPASAKALLEVDHSPLGYSKRWASVEKQLSTPLPLGYKLLVERFGQCCFGDQIDLLSPFTRKAGLHLVTDGRRMLSAFAKSVEGLEGFSVFPFAIEPGGLLPWAITTEGATLFFVMVGTPNHWPTMILMERGQDFEVKFHRTPAILLYQFLSGTLRSAILV